MYALLDRPQTALEVALASPDAVDFGVVWMPEAAELRRLPGFVELAERADLVDYWKQYGWPDDCRPVADRFQCGFSAIAAARSMQYHPAPSNREMRPVRTIRVFEYVLPQHLEDEGG